MLPFLKIHFPGKLVFANGCMAQLPEEILADAPARVLVLTIDPLLNRIKPLRVALEAAGAAVRVHTGIVQEPSFADFFRLMELAAPFNPDVVVGIGGGSVLDVAKLVAAQLDNEQKLNEYAGIGLLSGRKKKLICAPATSGTGSEVSPNAILVDDADGQKKGIISPYLVPDIVYVDPELTLSVPPQITAATGLDALVHCMEAYTNQFAQPFVDMMAYEGMRLIASHITKAVQEGNAIDAREKVSMGSLLGGFCLGPVNTAGVHALAYPLGTSFHIAHGLSNALLLPHVMLYNIPSAVEKYASVALALGCREQATVELTALAGVERVKHLIHDCGIPARLRDVQIPRDAIPQMAAAAMKIQRLLKNNPRVITEKDAVAIYEAAY